MGELGAHATKITVGLTRRRGRATPFVTGYGSAGSQGSSWHPFDNLAVLQRQFLSSPGGAALLGAPRNAII